jgi:hypothetical protein
MRRESRPHDSSVQPGTFTGRRDSASLARRQSSFGRMRPGAILLVLAVALTGRDARGASTNTIAPAPCLEFITWVSGGTNAQNTYWEHYVEGYKVGLTGVHRTCCLAPGTPDGEARISGWYDGLNAGGRTGSSLRQIGELSRYYCKCFTNWPGSLNELLAAAGHPPLSFQPEAHGLRTNDVWGRALIYLPFDRSLGYGAVVTYGLDGKPGGKDLDLDIEIRFNGNKSISYPPPNPQGGANGSQPIGSGTNRTSEAAGSRRSP